MGLFASLFGKKTDPKKETIHIEVNTEQRITPKKAVSFRKKGIPDINGLYPEDLIMLALAEKIKTTEKDNFGYMDSKYEITNPVKDLMDLYENGFLKIGSVKDSLNDLKVTDLKNIATELGLKAKGKKADIIATLQEADENSLSNYVKDRYWKRTDLGEKALIDNPYIPYFLDKHTYNLNAAEVDIWTVNKEFIANPRRPYRDIIFRLIEAKGYECEMEYVKNPRNVYPLRQMCDCYEIMALFIEEEKSYVNASDYYFRYIFRKINCYATADFLYKYNLFKDYKKEQKELIDNFYEEIQLYSHERTTIRRLIDERGLSDEEVREALIVSFKRTGDKGVMDEEETADFVLLELTGDKDSAIQMAREAARRLTKRFAKTVQELKNQRRR